MAAILTFPCRKFQFLAKPCAEQAQTHSQNWIPINSKPQVASFHRTNSLLKKKKIAPELRVNFCPIFGNVKIVAKYKTEKRFVRVRPKDVKPFIVELLRISDFLSLKENEGKKSGALGFMYSRETTSDYFEFRMRQGFIYIKSMDIFGSEDFDWIQIPPNDIANVVQQLDTFLEKMKE